MAVIQAVNQPIPIASFSVWYMVVSVFLCNMGCAENIVVDDQGENVDVPYNHVPNRSEDPEWFQDLILLGNTELGITGVDILLVVDNDPAMEVARNRMSTALYSLISELLHPVNNDAVKALRVAMTTTDMGLQYQRLFRNDSNDDSSLYDVMDGGVAPEEYGCDWYGDNGNLLTPSNGKERIPLASYHIRCDEYGGQCPVGWQCLMGRCVAGAQGESALCPNGTGTIQNATSSDSLFAANTACMIHGHSSECVVRQPLEAVVKLMSRESGFLVPNHLLMILILSGRDDCSISDPAVFEYFDGALDNSRIACFMNGNDIKFLYPIEEYYERFLDLKGGNPQAVLFSVMVGAPISACDGTGQDAFNKGCLLSENMSSSRWRDFENEKGSYYDIEPACQFVVGARLEESPHPGRRLVELATKFGEKGYVQSVCNENWDAMVSHLATSTHDLMSVGECRIDSPLKMDLKKSICPDCILSKCRLYAKYVRSGEAAEDKTCPIDLVFGEDYGRSAGYALDGDKTVVICPIAPIAAPIDCEDAKAFVDKDAIGWYYCERKTFDETTEATCRDGVDNDVDGVTDCEESSCEGCFVCGDSKGCALGCPYDIILTPGAEALAGNNLFMECPGDII